MATGRLRHLLEQKPGNPFRKLDLSGTVNAGCLLDFGPTRSSVGTVRAEPKSVTHTRSRRKKTILSSGDVCHTCAAFLHLSDKAVIRQLAENADRLELDERFGLFSSIEICISQQMLTEQQSVRSALINWRCAVSLSPIAWWHTFPGAESTTKGVWVFEAKQIRSLIQFQYRI